MDSNRSLRTIFFEFQTEKPKGKQVENSSNSMEEDSEREQEKGHAMGADVELRHMADTGCHVLEESVRERIRLLRVVVGKPSVHEAMLRKQNGKKKKKSLSLNNIQLWANLESNITTEPGMGILRRKMPPISLKN